MQDDHGNEPVGDSVIPSSPQLKPPTTAGPDPAMLQKKNEHMSRGIAHRERGEYDKAIDEFAAACRLASKLGSDWEECDENLERMLFVLHYFFNPEVDPDSFRCWEGEPLPEATLREMAAKTIFPPGYLVTGGNYVFASYPLTEEGRAIAIEHARRLAHEGWRDRHKHPGTILGDVSDFHMVVYRHERRPEEICWFHYDS